MKIIFIQAILTLEWRMPNCSKHQWHTLWTLLQLEGDCLQVSFSITLQD